MQMTFNIGELHYMPEGFSYKTINDGYNVRPLMDRGDGLVKVFYKLKNFRDNKDHKFVSDILRNVGWQGNQYFDTHELMGELDSTLTRFDVQDLQMSLGRVWDVMQGDYWALERYPDKSTGKNYGDRLVRDLLDKNKVGHISMEVGDMIQFQGMTFILLLEEVYEYKGNGYGEWTGINQRWCQVVKQLDVYGKTEHVDLIGVS